MSTSNKWWYWCRTTYSILKKNSQAQILSKNVHQTMHVTLKRNTNNSVDLGNQSTIRVISSPEFWDSVAASADLIETQLIKREEIILP